MDINLETQIREIIRDWLKFNAGNVLKDVMASRLVVQDDIDRLPDAIVEHPSTYVGYSDKWRNFRESIWDTGGIVEEEIDSLLGNS